MATPNNPATDETSPTLIGSAQAREPDAWRKLVRLYSPVVFRWTKRAGLRDEDAADIVQEVWTSVSVHLTGFRLDRDGATFRGWLWTVTRNKVRDLARQREDSAQGVGGTGAQIALANIPEVEPVEETNHDTPGLVERALELVRPDFEPHTWRAFWRTAIDGRPAREVAEELGMAPNAVHQARFRIVKRLRQELTALGVDEDPSFAGVAPARAPTSRIEDA
jgi:RNA polymerase sigma-70 factor (ECF subfamily)